MNPRQVGTYSLDKEKCFHPAQEYAGACETVKVPAGDYPIVVYPAGLDYVYYIQFQGTLIFSSWSNSLGTKVSRPMTPSQCSITRYRWDLEKDSSAVLD